MDSTAFSLIFAKAEMLGRDLVFLVGGAGWLTGRLPQLLPGGSGQRSENAAVPLAHDVSA